MALEVTTLAKAIQAAFDSESDKDVKPAEARQRQAQKIADAINAFVKGGDVNVTVTTTGSATAQSGTGKGKLT